MNRCSGDGSIFETGSSTCGRVKGYCCLVQVPESRIVLNNEKEVNGAGEFVLYWMVANRRLSWNYSLDRAVYWANKLNKPLVVFEPLRLGYQWASLRVHQFVVEGMADNQGECERHGIQYFPFVEETDGGGKGLLFELASRACCVVTDWFPSFFLPRMTNAAMELSSVKMEAVDSNGVLPLSLSERTFTTAYSFRRFLQKTLPAVLGEWPCQSPLDDVAHKNAIDLADVEKQYPKADIEKLLSGELAKWDFANEVPPVSFRGGPLEAQRVMESFFAERFPNYAEKRNSIDDGAASGLSPYLHFGHISAHEVVLRVLKESQWTQELLAPKATGSRNGWWGISEYGEAFLDELITWRELGYVFQHHNLDSYDQLSSLPAWALQTIDEHREDPREHTYSLEELETARTHDPLWNAAQNQLRIEGRIHNYLRMLWGKKIYQWSPTPESALEALIELNNKYAIDGRNPNSYTGIFWTLGRFDRAWGPERPVFGKLRYMTSESTARKIKTKAYVKRFGADAWQQQLF